jgi:hypothetical protein
VNLKGILFPAKFLRRCASEDYDYVKKERIGKCIVMHILFTDVLCFCLSY